jgi:hypothetical protein
MTFPTPPGERIVAAPEVFAYPPQMPGVNTSTAPVTTVTTPSFPATTVVVTNTTGVDVMVYIANGSGAMSAVKVNTVATGLAPIATTGNASVYLPAGATISCTYGSGSPSWVWMAV